MRYLHERKIISSSYVDIYVASNMSRMEYPFILQAPQYASKRNRDNALRYIMDSGIGKNSIGNKEVLDKAHELRATHIVPADVLHDQEATTEAVREFLDLYEDHPCTAKPLIPLQPPHDEHYRELSGYSHYMVGGVKNADAQDQIEAVKNLREVAGDGIYVHLLGAGCSKTITDAIRNNPRLIDSLDVSTPEQMGINSKVLDENMKQISFDIPCGKESSTLRAGVAKQAVMTLNYVLSPFYDGNDTQTTFNNISSEG